MLPFINAIRELEKLVREQEDLIDTLLIKLECEGRFPTGGEVTSVMRKSFVVECKHEEYGSCRFTIPHYSHPIGVKSYGGIAGGLIPACQLYFIDHRFLLKWNTLKEMADEIKFGGMWKKCKFYGPEAMKKSWILADIPCSITFDS